MPGLLTSLRIDRGVTDGAVIDLDDLVVAGLMFRASDRQCIACNSSFAQMVGRPGIERIDCMIDDFVVDPGAIVAMHACCDVLLRAAGASIPATAVPMPVLNRGERACLCFFLPRPPQDWRNADLTTAINEVIRDDMRWFSGAVMDRLARQRSNSARASGLKILTRRERQVLKYVCEGHNDAHIAEAMAITRNTLRNHLANIYDKAGVRRRSDAVVWGRDRGIGET